MMVRIKQNYKLIPEKSLVGLAVSQYETDTLEFVQYAQLPEQARPAEVEFGGDGRWLLQGQPLGSYEKTNDSYVSDSHLRSLHQYPRSVGNGITSSDYAQR
jgi:hypothetical protein